MKKLMTACLLSATTVLTGAAYAKDLMPAEVEQLTQAGAIKTLAELNNILLELHPGAVVTDAEFETSSLQGYVYEAELYDAQGAEWDIDLNAATGAVIKNQRDY
ncbi:PepSY domain-containing protein [Pseudomonas sp. F1_0610]|uniref:PepSY domain-containing protein n=1 Tax=Pseudomonas sp. F1_0610 TaxID=3114284 RepID=UPI0039C0CD40